MADVTHRDRTLGEPPADAATQALPACTEVDAGLEIGAPVPGFPIRFCWHSGWWYRLFDKQIALIERDIARAIVEGAVMVFQSTPLSGRGGGHFATNVEIAEHTTRRLSEEWGHRFWFLNPARYQMESKEGTGLMHLHAAQLSQETGEEIDVDSLFRADPPIGGDYMRMWTKVLVEDGEDDAGRRWDAIYFLGPADVRDFFTEGGARTLTAGVEEYFARKIAMDQGFHEVFAPPFLDPDGRRLTGRAERDEWRRRREAFFRYYTIRAGTNFSLGSHDEWNIWQLLNVRRRIASPSGTADQIAGFFDGRQIDPAASAAATSTGYAVEEDDGTV